MEQELSKQDARKLIDQIAKTDERSFELRCRAYHGKAWVALGYPTWEALCRAEFPRYKLTVEQQAEEIEAYRKAGLSNRATASALGVDQHTVRRNTPRSSVGAANAAPAPAVAKVKTNPKPPEATTPPPPPPVTGQDGKKYASRRGDPQAEMQLARQVAVLRETEPTLSLEEVATKCNTTERNVRRLTPLGNLPQEVQTRIENQEITMRAAELLSTVKMSDTIKMSDEDKIGLATKIAAGKIADDREVLPSVFATIKMWPKDFREDFYSSDRTFDEQAQLRAEQDEELRKRQKRATEARKYSNAMPRNSYGPSMLQQLLRLDSALIDLTKNFDFVTVEVKESLLDRCEDIIMHARAVLDAGGRTRTPHPAQAQTPAPRKKAEVIDGEIV